MKIRRGTKRLTILDNVVELGSDSFISTSSGGVVPSSNMFNAIDTVSNSLNTKNINLFNYKELRKNGRLNTYDLLNFIRNFTEDKALNDWVGNTMYVFEAKPIYNKPMKSNLSYYEKILNFFSIRKSRKIFNDALRIADKVYEDAIKDITNDAAGFFESVKSELMKTEKYESRINKLNKLIEDARNSGQIALMEKLNSVKKIEHRKAIVYAAGIDRAVDQSTIVKFGDKFTKGLSIDPIKNYIRHIPNEIVDKISSLRKDKVFDDFFILHYDEEEKSLSETEEEKKIRIAKEKDPILFGVLAGCDTLYYVADWIDEYCDLTFDKLIDVIGEDNVIDVDNERI